MAMQRARRLVSVAVLASVAVAGLSACRSEPSVAAYVGDTKVTEARVEAVFDEASKQAAAGGEQAGQPPAPVITRTDVVRALLGAAVLERVAREKKVTLPADISIGEYAQSLRLPETAEYVRLFAQVDTYVRLLREGVKNAPEPSDDDLREVFEVLVANAQVNASGTFEEFKSSLPPQNKQLVQTAAEVRNQIAEVAEPMDIKVNPRYQPAGIPVLQFQTAEGQVQPLLTVPLGDDATNPVTDVR
jgi:parvulin-like peptidyl-prolyl isomerase